MDSKHNNLERSAINRHVSQDSPCFPSQKRKLANNWEKCLPDKVSFLSTSSLLMDSLGVNLPRKFCELKDAPTEPISTKEYYGLLKGSLTTRREQNTVSVDYIGFKDLAFEGDLGSEKDLAFFGESQGVYYVRQVVFIKFFKVFIYRKCYIDWSIFQPNYYHFRKLIYKKTGRREDLIDSWQIYHFYLQSGFKDEIGLVFDGLSDFSTPTKTWGDALKDKLKGRHANRRARLRSFFSKLSHREGTYCNDTTPSPIALSCLEDIELGQRENSTSHLSSSESMVEKWIIDIS